MSCIIPSLWFKIAKNILILIFYFYIYTNFSSQQADESLNFEEQILEAAKSITAAAGALVKAATAAQRELVATGRVSVLVFFNFNCWIVNVTLEGLERGPIIGYATPFTY